MSFLSFHGRVVVVTGAGRGIGRGYAKEFARRGAMVVVNDLDKTCDGMDPTLRPAEQVVQEITDAGGQAVANFDSVEHGESIIQTALSHFGRVDVVVNNAGILRDKAFRNMSDTDWDTVQNIHLKGAFNMTKAAWPHFIERRFGRLIFVSSNSGIYGNFGQANYAAAKCGLIGLSNTLAIEGTKYNIHSNVIVPTAFSRMTKNLFPDEFLERLKPEDIAPMVVYLSHDTTKETGNVYEAAGGWFGRVQFQRSVGSILTDATAEAVRDAIHDIKDMTHAKHFDSMQEVMENMLEVTMKKSTKNTQPEANAEGTSDFGREPMKAKL